MLEIERVGMAGWQRMYGIYRRTKVVATLITKVIGRRKRNVVAAGANVEYAVAMQEE